MFLHLECLAVVCALVPNQDGEASWEGDLLGAELASLGDLDGDGRGDFAVGAPTDRADVGCVWLVSGAKGTVLRCLEGPSGARWFGWRMSATGDLDGDGLSDLAVGSIEGERAIRFYYSARGRALFTVEGATLGRTLGRFACVGDVNDDETSDLAVVCHTRLSCGELLLLSGKDGSILRAIEAAAILELNPSHGDVVGCSDLNADGVPDLLVGLDEGHEGRHRAAVISGLDGTPVFLLDVPKERGAQGTCVSLAGDVDGDSIPDLAIATPWQVFFSNEEPTPRATVTIHSGKDGRVLLRPKFPVEGRGLDFGHAMALAGDVDGDGRDDVVIAAPGCFAGVVLFGGADGGALRYWPAHLRRGFGESVAVVGDVDGDGTVDVAIGVANWNSPTEPGAVVLCSGSDGSVLYEVSTKTLR